MEPYSQFITIQASADLVWKNLTDQDLMRQWTSDDDLEIITGWIVSGRIVIKATGHWVYAESKGLVLEFEKERLIKYSHLNSLSKLDYNNPKNYSEIMFRLVPHKQHTELVQELNNFPTAAIYHHLVFYWKITLEVLKRFIEKQAVETK